MELILQKLNAIENRLGNLDAIENRLGYLENSRAQGPTQTNRAYLLPTPNISRGGDPPNISREQQREQYPYSRAVMSMRTPFNLPQRPQHQQLPSNNRLPPPPVRPLLPHRDPYQAPFQPHHDPNHLPRKPNFNLDQDTNTLKNNWFNTLRLKHQLHTWQGLPSSIDSKIDNLVGHIHLPLENEVYKDKLQAVGNNFRTELLLVSQEHLTNKLNELKNSRIKLDANQTRAAITTAKTQLLKAYKKIPQNILNKWVNEEQAPPTVTGTVPTPTITADATPMTTVTTTKKRPPPTPSPTIGGVPTHNRFTSLSLDNEGGSETLTEEDFPTLPPPAPPTVLFNPKRRKINPQGGVVRPTQNAGPMNTDLGAESSQISLRLESSGEGAEPSSQISVDTEGGQLTASESGNTPIHAVLEGSTSEESEGEDILENSLMSEGGEAIVLSDDPLSGGVASNLTTTKPLNTGGFEKDLGNVPLTMEEGFNTLRRHPNQPKCNWAVRPGEGAEFVVISDSNLNLAKSLPSNWEVNVYGGATFSHMATILNNFVPFHTKYNKLRAIVVSVGINSRGNKRHLTTVEHNKLMRAMGRFKVPVFLLGVSPPQTLSEREAQEIHAINQYSRENFGSVFIEPLPANQVSVLPSDKYGIHYDQSTVNKICFRMHDFLCIRGPMRDRRRRISL